LQPGVAAVPKVLKDELEIEDSVEIVVSGKRRLTLKAKEIESEEERVYVCPDDVKSLGISNNSIATIRRPLEK